MCFYKGHRCFKVLLENRQLAASNGAHLKRPMLFLNKSLPMSPSLKVKSTNILNMNSLCRIQTQIPQSIHYGVFLSF